MENLKLQNEKEKVKARKKDEMSFAKKKNN